MSTPFSLPFPVFTPNVDADATQMNANWAAIIAALNSSTFQGYPTLISASAAPYNMSPSALASVNTTGLQAAINAAANQGGIVFIPAGTYQLNNTITIQNVVGGVVIMGSSAGTKLVQNNPADMFLCSNNSETNPQGGVNFTYVWFEYANTASSGTAINCINGGALTVAEHCFFNNCPCAFSAGTDGNALSCGLYACTVAQNKWANTTQVILSGAQCFVDQCVVRQLPINSSGPLGCYGVKIYKGTDNYVTNTHVSDFSYGVQIAEGAQWTFVTNNFIGSVYNAIIVQPSTGAGTIYGAFITANQIALTNYSTQQTSGVYIDSQGGAATNVSGVYLSSNLIYGFNNAGVQVNLCRDVTIAGGQISSNGLNPTSVAVGAGIAITAAALNVLITGVNLSGVFPFQGSTQPYGLAVSAGGAANVIGCDMTGNGTSALYTSSPGTLNLFNNVGYNTAPPSMLNLVPNGAQTTLASLGYYGPGSVYLSGGTITAVLIGGTNVVQGQAIGSSKPSFRMPSANQYFNVGWSATPCTIIIGE